jgi:hypothetical protein
MMKEQLNESQKKTANKQKRLIKIAKSSYVKA